MSESTAKKIFNALKTVAGKTWDYLLEQQEIFDEEQDKVSNMNKERMMHEYEHLQRNHLSDHRSLYRKHAIEERLKEENGDSE